jgi:hypothetical protein
MRRKTPTMTCQEPGCKNRVKKIRHSGNKAKYGTLCSFHREQHRRQLALEYTRRVRNIPPERWGKGSHWRIRRNQTDPAQSEPANDSAAQEQKEEG